MPSTSHHSRLTSHFGAVLAVFVLFAFTAPAQRRSALAPAPDWTELDQFQETITREEFVRLLNDVYAPGGAAEGLVDVGAESVTIRKTLAPAESMTLRFAADRTSAKTEPRFWRAPGQLGPADPAQPLAGLRIALDPGHLGGEWARMEERWFRIGESAPVTEGDMTLRVAELLAPQLRALGAEVLFIRNAAGPTTQARPAMLREAARAELALQGVAQPRETYDGPDDAGRGTTVQFQSELLFFRISEIRHRADVVNRVLQPDLTLCIHFNAEAWGDPRAPTFVPRNHLHVLVNGAYSAGELRNDDVRFEMLTKLLNRCFAEELAASENVAAALADATGLAPYEYPRDNARRVGQSAFLWARNLLANRLYRTPVIFLEPYVMNSQEVWDRVQAGDYEGERSIAGVMRRSIYREYADAVVAGLKEYYSAARTRGPQRPRMRF